MSDAEVQTQRFAIEAGGRVVGLVVEEKSGYRFFAAKRRFVPLDQMLFRSPAHAENACHRLEQSHRRRLLRGRRQAADAAYVPAAFVPVAGAPLGWPFDHF